MKKSFLTILLFTLVSIQAILCANETAAIKVILDDKFETIDKTLWNPTIGVKLSDGSVTLADGAMMRAVKPLPQEYTIETKFSLLNPVKSEFSGLKIGNNIFTVFPDGTAYFICGKQSRRTKIENFKQDEPITITVTCENAETLSRYTMWLNGQRIASAQIDQLSESANTFLIWARKCEMKLYSVKIFQAVK
ncbi:MAG: hypothetical protein LBM70_09080 [Victivallales bacterium]|jgi:hypothetical protein|nr:hypothetical protein [Victivallales bacterium]